LSARYKFLHDHKGVQVDCYGNLTSTELFNVNAAIFGDPKAVALHFQVIDLSDVESLEIPAEHLLRLAKEDRSHLESNPQLKLAFVTNHAVVRSVVFMWRGHIKLSEQFVQQFSSLQQAYEWLGYEQSVQPA